MEDRPDSEPDSEPEPEEKAERRTPFWLELPGLLITALAVAVVVKTFLVQPFYIPSESMFPTIEINDRVIVNKLAYQLGEPERGDIVVFLNPSLTDEELQETLPEAVIRAVLEAVGVRSRPEEDLIKRIVATGGETVAIEDGLLVVDGIGYEEPYLRGDGGMGDFGPRTVPEDHVFVMGDNRGSSMDSRSFGAIPEDEIIGQALVRIWPLDRLGSI